MKAFDFQLTYTFDFKEGTVVVFGANSYAEAEETARGKAMKLGWDHTKVLTYKAEREKQSWK